MNEIYSGPVKCGDNYLVILKDRSTGRFETQELPIKDCSLVANFGLCIGLTLDQACVKLSELSAVQITHL